MYYLCTYLFQISFFFPKASTETHSEVDNFAPSISAAIGSFSPQKYVWQACIYLHIGPRFRFLFLYKQFYQAQLNLKILSTWLQVHAAFFFNLFELLALLGLTLVSSQDDSDIHKVCFVVFGLSGLAYFTITWYIWRFCLEKTNDQKLSLKTKARALKTFLSCGLLMSYFYYRHNEFCEPYVYSLFSLCEYVMVGANMWFHSTASNDLGHKKGATISYLPLYR